MAVERDSINWFRRGLYTPGEVHPRGGPPRTVVATDYVRGIDAPITQGAARVRRNRLTTASSVSLGFHLLLGLGLFLQHVGAPFGAIGPDVGTGLQVSLVSGFAAGGPDAGDRDVSTPESTQARDEVRPETPEVLTGGEAAATDMPTPQDRQAPAQPPSEASAARGEGGQAAGAFDGAQGASDSRGGDPLAVSDLLAQVARCLKPDFRPALGFSQLRLSIGSDGRLRVPPVVQSALPQLSPADRLAADRIVQAALLCGPYLHPNTLNRTVSLPADFSAIAPGAHAEGGRIAPAAPAVPLGS